MRLIPNEAVNKGAHRGAKAEPAGVINIIAGGSSLKEVATKRKRHGGEVIFIGLNNLQLIALVIFTSEDKNTVTSPHTDALMVEGMVENFILKRMLVDDGSAVNLLTFEVYVALGLSPKKLRPVYTPLIGLGGK